MGSVQIYKINYYASLDNTPEKVAQIRDEAILESRLEQGKVLLHLHAYTDKACEYKSDLHEVYDKGVKVDE